MKDGSLEINSLVQNVLSNCLSYRNVFQNGVNALSKTVFKTPSFVKKIMISCSLDHTILFKFTSMGFKYLSNTVWRVLRLSMSTLATVAGKSLNSKLLQSCFSDRAFYVTITDTDIGSLKSLHTLFD